MSEYEYLKGIEIEDEPVLEIIQKNSKVKFDFDEDNIMLTKE